MRRRLRIESIRRWDAGRQTAETVRASIIAIVRENVYHAIPSTLASGSISSRLTAKLTVDDVFVSFEPVRGETLQQTRIFRLMERAQARIQNLAIFESINDTLYILYFILMYKITINWWNCD